MAHSPAPSAPALTFTFSAQALRVILRNGEPWFVAADVCDALTIGNSRMALDRLDDDEKGVSSIDTLGGAQEMSVINESGLYSLILGSRKPEAKKFKKWVTAEVLPAIRKTGRYVASNDPQATTPPPARIAEHLSGSDMLNLKRMIWLCSTGFRFDTAWTQGIWFYLRKALGLPSPQPFTVDHLPQLGMELQRIHAISYQVQEITQKIEAQAARRIFRKGEAADVVLADLQRLADEGMADVTDNLAKLPRYFQHEHTALTQRHPHAGVANYGANEKPEYFQGSAA